jgi:hypothetical protein
VNTSSRTLSPHLNIYLQQDSLKHFKAMNSRKHEKSAASLDGSEDDNEDSDDEGPHNLSDSNVDMSVQTGKIPVQPATPWTYKEGQFWNYVDDELAKIRKVVQDASSSMSDADVKMTEYVLAHFISSRSLI